MIIKRFEMDVTNLLNAYEESELFLGKTIYEIENNLKLEVSYFLEFDSSSDLMKIIKYEFIENPNNMEIIINSEKEHKESYSSTAFSLINEFEFKTIQNGIEKEYLVLIKPIVIEKNYNKEFFKRVKDIAKHYSGIIQWCEIADSDEPLLRLFYYEDATVKGLIALIYYYLYLSYAIRKDMYEISTKSFRDIINQKAEYVGIPYNNSKKEFKELIKDIKLKDETEKIAILLEIINSTSLIDDDLLTLINFYEYIFK